MASSYKYTKECIERRRKELDKLKEEPCSRCGIKFPPYVMDWHHLDPSTKLFGVGKGTYRNSMKLILEEISKCILLCANCHRIVEHEIKLQIRAEASSGLS